MITFLRIGSLGRLANQMFQFSATVGIARKIGVDPVFPIENFRTETPDSFTGAKLLECFDIPDRYFSKYSDISRLIQFNYSEPHFNFDPNCVRIPNNSNLDGYFQSERYFIESKDEILNCFSFRKNIIEEAKNIFETIDFNKSVSVHVRRGDYLSSPNHHPTQSIEYYSEAFQKYEGMKKIIFSDDPDWCEINLKNIGDIQVIKEGNPYVSLYLMSNFKNHIISNSSFSWWAYWLCGDKSSAIAPKEWFGPALPHDTCDLYPPGCQII